jgi:hypothetical protein
MAPASTEGVPPALAPAPARAAAPAATAEVERATPPLSVTTTGWSSAAAPSLLRASPLRMLPPAALQPPLGCGCGCCCCCCGMGAPCTLPKSALLAAKLLPRLDASAACSISMAGPAVPLTPAVLRPSRAAAATAGCCCCWAASLGANTSANASLMCAKRCDRCSSKRPASPAPAGGDCSVPLLRSPGEPGALPAGDCCCTACCTGGACCGAWCCCCACAAPVSCTRLLSCLSAACCCRMAAIACVALLPVCAPLPAAPTSWTLTLALSPLLGVRPDPRPAAAA